MKSDLLSKYDLKDTYFEYNFLSSKIPTIFIHGVGLDNTMWYPQKKYLINKSTIYYDILNHGKSKSGFNNLSFELFSEQLLNLIQNLSIKKVNLVGFSIGALIAQHFTQKNYDKINKLVLIGSVYKRTKKQISIVKNRYKEAIKGKSITKDSIKRWFNQDYLKNNVKVHDFFYDLLENKKNQNFLPVYKLFVESDKYKINFNNFNMPTLIMTGEKEVGSPPIMSIGLHKKIKNSKIYIINNAKHGATIEKAEEVNTQLFKFLF
tara:strand:+ start:2424 stop:3212 length:789 start_codon:yes stop_codon:yes gene_type:complete